MSFFIRLRDHILEPFTTETNPPQQKVIFRMPTPSISSTITNQFRITGNLATGSSGDIYVARDVDDGTEVAIKVCPRRQTHEARAYMTVLDHDPAPIGIPKTLRYEWSDADTYTFLVIQLLGESLADISLMMGGRLSVKDVCMIAIRTLTSIQHVHSKGLLHGDINPGNIVMGKKSERGIVYLIDFEESQRFIDHKGNHIPPTRGNKIKCNFCYASINFHTGMQLSRRDDLISLGYSLIRLLSGSLPWEKNGDELLEKREVVKRKKEIKWDVLCKELPVQFNIYLKSVQGLAFCEVPEYDSLIWLFKNCLENCGKVDDGKFEGFVHPEFALK